MPRPQALEEVAGRLDESFLEAVDLLHHCPGRVAITGTGKSADVGQKIAGTLNSTGTRAYVLDATKAMHGDLGMVHPSDIALVLSHSGESEEIVRLLDPSAAAGAGARRRHRQRRTAPWPAAPTWPWCTARSSEACPLGLAPSTSTTAMIAWAMPWLSS